MPSLRDYAPGGLANNHSKPQISWIGWQKEKLTSSHRWECKALHKRRESDNLGRLGACPELRGTKSYCKLSSSVDNFWLNSWALWQRSRKLLKPQKPITTSHQTTTTPPPHHRRRSRLLLLPLPPPTPQPSLAIPCAPCKNNGKADCDQASACEPRPKRFSENCFYCNQFFLREETFWDLTWISLILIKTMLVCITITNISPSNSQFQHSLEGLYLHPH